jgi:hypothetical protein
MPARRDIDPADLRQLLPHLIISKREDSQFRHRLYGTGVVETLGFDATRYFVGEYLDNPNFHAEARAAYDTLFGLRDPVFVTGEFYFKSLRAGALYAWSTLILPLSEDQVTVDQTISSFIAHLHPQPTLTPDWLEYQPAKVLEVNDVSDAEELERLCLG